MGFAFGDFHIGAQDHAHETVCEIKFLVLDVQGHANGILQRDCLGAGAREDRYQSFQFRPVQIGPLNAFAVAVGPIDFSAREIQLDLFPRRQASGLYQVFLIALDRRAVEMGALDAAPGTSRHVGPVDAIAQKIQSDAVGSFQAGDELFDARAIGAGPRQMPAAHPIDHPERRGGFLRHRPVAGHCGGRQKRSGKTDRESGFHASIPFIPLRSRNFA